MSKFVNYNKRGVTLPPGCKDLVDLLQPRGSVVFEENIDRERFMREFFVRRGLELPGEDSIPTQFMAGVPVYHIYNILPLPADAAAATELSTAMFRTVCRLSEGCQLTFRFCEITNSA